MPILHKENIFHLYNEDLSYIFTILENGQLGQLYYGAKINENTSASHMLQLRGCVLATASFPNNNDFLLDVIKQEYPSYGTGDFRDPAFSLRDQQGSTVTNFVYQSHEIYQGKKEITNLPATYGSKEEVTTLEVTLHDDVINVDLVLVYSIFENHGVLTRSARFVNRGFQDIAIERAMSMSIDLYDSNYEMIQLDGAWSRERHIHSRPLTYGVQSISSTRGTSSSSHNPFIALKRPNTTESSGEAFGFNFVYSGNFLGQVQVDNFEVARVMMGINPFEFEWCLQPGGVFETPEVVCSYSLKGLNGMSQQFHNLYRENLMRGPYKGKTRPILINNWEATYFDFTEESILKIASKAKESGIELFVLDDGWFGKRNDDFTSLGDWYTDYDKLPNGIEGLASKVVDLGLDFGLWFEPEMTNEVSDLYKKHPEWIISTPNRNRSYGRNQFVLDYTKQEVIDYIYELMAEVLSKAPISYIKWDMNRNITEAFTTSLPAHRQKEFFHRYILGVYQLYQRLIDAFPHILFESCASGGARFDAGMLYYAPQAWTSDETDAVERLKIQTGTSMAYPIVSMGSHVSAVPNHQVLRNTSLKMRGDVAFFGTFGYELDLNLISKEEQEEVKQQIQFFKQYRSLIQFGDFYRLEKGERGLYSWMVVSKDKKQAIIGCYKILANPNPALRKVQLQGLDPQIEYTCTNRDETYYGDELMNFGFLYELQYTGVEVPASMPNLHTCGTDKGDFTSFVFVLEAK